MIYIQQNTTNQIFVNVSEFKTLPNPYYLWRLQNVQSQEIISFIPENITSTYPSFYRNKYDVFEFNTFLSAGTNFIYSVGNPVNLNLINNNEYWLGIYETLSASTNVNLATEKLLTSLAFIFVDATEDVYTGNTNNFANNVVYNSNQILPTPSPSNTPSITPTNTPTTTLTTTPTTTSTPTTTPTTTTTLTTTPTTTTTLTTTPSPTSSPGSTPTATPSNTPSNTPSITPTQTPTNTSTQTPTTTPTNTSTHTPTTTPSITPTNTQTPTNTNTPTPSITSSNTPTPTPTITATNTQTPTTTQTPTSTNLPLDCSWSGTSSSWENNPNLWSVCAPIPTPTNTPTPSITPSITPSPTNTPSQTPTQTPTKTNTPTPSITPSITPSPVPVLTFYVSSGSTSLQACQTGPSFYVYAQDLGNCAGCLPLNCWACLTTGQQVYSDPYLTIPVGTGYYNTNMNTSGGDNYATWYIVGGFPQGAGFNGCGIVPTPTMTSTPTPTPTQFCKRYTGSQTSVGNGAKYNYTACNGITGEYWMPNSVIGYSPTIYAVSPPTKVSGTGVMTWTDNGFANPCSGSTFTRITCESGLGTYWSVVDCGGASYTQSLLSVGQSFTGCFTSLTCNSNCISPTYYTQTNYGSCST